MGLCSQTPLGELATLPERMKIDTKKVKRMRYGPTSVNGIMDRVNDKRMCVLDNISRPHRQRSNAARKLKSFWRRCRINTNRIGIQKEVTWTFGGTGQEALSNALIESV